MPFYGGSVAGGYAQGLQANQQAAVRDAQLKAYLQQLAQRQAAFKQQQDTIERTKAARMGAGIDWQNQQLAPPPADPGQGQPPVQPPAPGASSPGGTPNGGPPPQPQGQQGGGQIMPPPGPGPAAPPAAASPSWQPMPSAPPGGGTAPAPTGLGQLQPPPKDAMKTTSGAVPFHNQELAAYAKAWKAQGLNGEQIMDRLEVLTPMMNSEQKQQLAQMKQMLDIQKQVSAYQEKLIADARANESLGLRRQEITSLDENRKEMRAQGQQRISIAKQRLNVQVANAAGGKANLKSVEYIYPKGADGRPDVSQPPIGTRGVTKSGKIIQLDIEGNTLNPRAAGGGTAKEGAALAAKGQKSITNLKEDRRVLIAAGTPLSDPRVKALDDKISAMEKGGQGGGAPKKKVGDIVPVNGKLYKVTGFDKDGEPLVVPAQ